MEIFYLKKRNGETLSIVCEWGKTRNGFKHTATCVESGDKEKVCYLNRTWECYEYESVLTKLVNKMFADEELDFVLAQLKERANKTKEDCEKWFDSWKQKFDSLSPETKEHIANSGVVASTPEEAEAIVNLGLMFDLLK